MVRRVTSLGDTLKGSELATGGATMAAFEAGHIRRASSVGETVSVALKGSEVARGGATTAAFKTGHV